jgi:thiosulfate/3-mercaptopyruvate sulfurtransferase
MVIFSFLTPVRSAEAACNFALIQPEELNRDFTTWVILDARPKSEWQAGRLQGARSFSWEEYTRTDEQKIPYRMWPAEKLAEVLGKISISENTPIVVYGAADTSWGGEGWVCWVLAWLGHKGPIRLLAGGIQVWRSHGFPMVSGAEERHDAETKYHIQLKPEVGITTAQIEERGSGLVLVDTRSTLEWLTGHIPKAIHIPWNEFYTGANRVPLSPAGLKELLTGKKIAAGTPVIYYCSGGIRSGYAWLVHELSGFSSARNYEGGMEAWKRRPPH